VSKTVLVVDDDPAILEVIKIVLEEEGFVVYTDDGHSHQEYKCCPADLILLDIWMRGIDGRSIAKELKHGDHPAIVLLMSAHSDAETAVVETGADGFVAKPFELDDLVDVVKEYLK
jgi:DNA-binding response OmpR family regulator